MDDDVKPFALGQGQPQAPVMLTGLDRIAEKMGRRLRNIFEPLLGVKPTITMATPTAVIYGAWSEDVPDFTSISLYRVAPIKGMATLRLDSALIALLVDCYYGGKGTKVANKRREFTPTEDRVIARVSTAIMEKLVEAWNETLPLDVGLIARESSLDRAGIAQPEEPMMLQRYKLKLADHDWPIDVLIPMAALRAIEPLLETKVHDDIQVTDPIWQARLGARMSHVQLSARTILARPNMSVSELLQLEVGDVIPVNIDRYLPLLVGNRLVAHGSIGEQNGRAAFMIEHLAQGNEQ